MNLDKIFKDLDLYESNELPPIEKAKKRVRDAFFKYRKDSLNDSNKRYPSKYQFQGVYIEIAHRNLVLHRAYLNLYKKLKSIESEGIKARAKKDYKEVDILRKKWAFQNKELREFEANASQVVKNLKPYLMQIDIESAI